ncbi:hypothetical protein GGX14DRAFT_408384 [Mycena pura]|uniref:Uncharacterized protein n=1 Tax=Mycena pura TaxID=153505 RepID=A0AAD6ULF4_9AGAR|nr:hypothetical protein GGX14DRAFT_408384 [Mycena pura]
MPLPLPQLPAVPANAAEYCASPAEPAFSPPHAPLEGVDAPESPSSPEMTLLTGNLSNLYCIENNFRSLGHFMETLTENFPVGGPDPRSDKHQRIVSGWLCGRTGFHPVHLIEAIYRNRYSVPRYDAVHVDELNETFNGNRDLKTFHWARPGLSAWATQLVGKRCTMEIGKLGQNDPNHPNFRAFLQASVNPRMADKRATITQEDIFEFSMQRSGDILKSRAPL